ncbi:MAG: extracellular solute-binding protein [Eubacteriales bacterium]
MRLVKFICLLLSLALLIGLSAACGVKDDPDVSKEASSDVPDSSGDVSEKESTEEEKGPLDHLETQDLDRTVTFLVENYAGGGYGSHEIMPFEDTSIAVYVSERNNLVEEKLGVTIDEIRTDNMINDLRIAAQGVADFDVAMPYMTSAGPLIAEGLFYNLYDFDDIINFDAPYWDKNAENSMSLGGKLYMTTGDFSVLTMDVTHCTLFNKTLIDEKHLEDPYTLVKEGEWTMDKMLAMAKEVTADTDGEPGITFKDTVGLFINGNYANSLFIGSGESFAKKDPYGVPELTIYNNKSVGVVQKIFEIFSDDKVLHMESFQTQAQAAGYVNCYAAARDALGNNRALFVTISLSDVLSMSNYKDVCDFGLLVTPKYTKEQDRYYSYISIIFATGCVIPISNTEPEIAALVLEAMAAASTKTVKVNYYERILKLQKMQDEESGDMLDFIFDNRVYDIGALYNWNSMRDFVSTCVTGTTNTFISSFDSQKSAFESAMQDTIDFFSN